MKELRTVVPRTDIALPAKRAHCDRILVQSGQIVAVAAVHVAHPLEFGRNEAGEDGNKRGRQQSVDQFFSAVELGDHHVLSVVNAG